MEMTAERFAGALERQLSEIIKSNHALPQQYKAAVLTCKKAMRKVSRWLSATALASRETEMYYFKEVRPLFYSQYIYYVHLYNFSVHRPVGGAEIQEAYIRLHLTQIKQFFDHNRAFYAYYRTGGSQLDEAYFTRTGSELLTEPEDFEQDEQNGNGYCYKLSKIIAHERFERYLNVELAKLGIVTGGAPDWPSLLPFKLPNWTAAKVDAVELIYALKAAGAVNSGNIEISELIRLFEFVFQVDLRESYHRFGDITMRKKETAVFLNKLKDGLLRCVDDKFKL